MFTLVDTIPVESWNTLTIKELICMCMLFLTSFLEETATSSYPLAMFKNIPFATQKSCSLLICGCHMSCSSMLATVTVDCHVQHPHLVPMNE